MVLNYSLSRREVWLLKKKYFSLNFFVYQNNISFHIVRVEGWLPIRIKQQRGNGLNNKSQPRGPCVRFQLGLEFEPIVLLILTQPSQYKRAQSIFRFIDDFFSHLPFYPQIFFYQYSYITHFSFIELAIQAATIKKNTTQFYS